MIEEPEIWKDIPGVPNYQASSLGRVRSVDRYVPNSRGSGVRRMKGRVLVPGPHNNGYLIVRIGPQVLREGVRQRMVTVHRAVLCAFTGVALEHPFEVDHIDGNRRNNAVSNLRWVTINENRRNLHVASGVSATIGVHFSKGRRKPWTAAATVSGRYVFLGRFETEEEAVAARKKFEADYEWRPAA